MEGKLQVGWRFFKVIAFGCHTKLTLPPLVCGKLEGDDKLLETATLVTAKGRWEVGIGHGSKGKFYFEKGWDVFVQNHGLRVGEFAVFEYIGGGICFNVSLLDKNGSEKAFSQSEQGQNMASKLNPLTHQISQDEVLLEETVPPCSIEEKGEDVDLVAVKLEEDEDMITSHLNARLAPLYAILAEIDNEDLPSCTNIHEEDSNREHSQGNIPKHDNNKHIADQERSKENSSFASPAEIDSEKACPSEVKIQEQHAIKVPMKFEVDEVEDEVPSQIELRNPGKGRCSVKRKRDDKTVPSQAKSQKHDMNRCSAKKNRDDDKTPSQAKPQKHDMNKCSTKQARDDDDRAPSPAITQKHEKNKLPVKNDKNKSSLKQKNHKDQVPSKPKGCAQDKKGDTERKTELKVNTSSREQSLQFSTLMKPYHVRSRSPYMHIPAEFCVANELYQNARITLKGPSDERQVSLKVCKGGKTKYAIITRGWPEFIAGNNLEEGDTCIFKLPSKRSSSDAAVVLDVEVLRAST
nr:B3 domain-containing protein REM9-like [Ipomoea batatas]